MWSASTSSCSSSLPTADARRNSKVVAGSHEVAVEECGKLVTSETRCGECGLVATATTSPADMGKDGPQEEAAKAKNLALAL